MRIRSKQLALLAAAMWGAATSASAVDPPDLFLNNLADFVWTGAGGNSTWENAANWTPPTFPGGYPYPIPTYPNDPNRVDDPAIQLNVTQIWPAVGANLSGALAADRTVNIANGNVTVAGLKLGGTNAAVTTNVTATGEFRLVFENSELNDTVTNPGNPNVNPQIQPEPIYGFNQGRSLIWSTGTAGAGKENRISANVQLNDGVDVEGDRDLHIYGTIYEGDIDRDGLNTGFSETLESSISNLLSGGARLYLHGDIVSVGLSASGQVTASDGPGGDRRLGINVDRGILVPVDPQNPPAAVPRQGTVEILGKIQGNGLVTLGTLNGDQAPLGNVIVRSDNVAFAGRMEIARGNVVLAHDNALGGPKAGPTDDHKAKIGGPVQGFGANFISDSDTRTVPVPIEIAQWGIVRGANGMPGLEGIGDHSLTFSGEISQSNTRGWINLLPAGKTLTFSGGVYPNIKSENPPGDGRAITFDGSGKTIISGGIHNQILTGNEEPVHTDKTGYLRVRGTGTIVIDGRIFEAGVPTGHNASDYTGLTFVEGSNLHFRSSNDLGGGEMVSRGGAVGVDEGTRANSAFLTKLRNSSDPLWNPANSPFFATWGNTEAVYTNYSTGGLMLGNVGTNEYTQNLDFTTGDLARAANMSLAAHEGGSTYTGTITPSSTVPVNANSYQLGGGSGTLTVPNANQLTGARNLLVTNGGEVKLTNSNNYTGTTRILRKYLPSNTGQAENNQRQSGGNAEGTVTGLVPSTLSVSSLANGGAASSIGSSSSDASNLVIQGGALKYEGGAASTDRLFSVGTSGATLDASGSGAVNFTNTGALTISVPAPRSAVLAAAVPGGGSKIVFGQPSHPTATRREFHTEDLTVGMRVYSPTGDFNPPADGSPVRITSIINREVMGTGQPTLLPSEADTNASTLPNAWPGYPQTGIRTVQFGPAPARFLTLAGSNTGNNTLAPLIGDAPAAQLDAGATTAAVAAAEAAAGYGTVGINKTGAGTWVLTGNNTYSGATNVQQGTLLVNGNQTGNSLTTVSSGARFGGTGQIGGSLVLSEGAIFTAIAAGGTLDPLSVLGNVDLSALGNTLDVSGITSGTHTLLTYAGTLMGTFESTPGFTVNYGTGSNSLISITKVASLLVGDYNSDGKVDAADYTVWRDKLGAAGGTLANRDPANTGTISQADYNSWKTNFGQILGSGALTTAAVPEPGSILLLGIGLVGLARVRRRVAAA